MRGSVGAAPPPLPERRSTTMATPTPVEMEVTGGDRSPVLHRERDAHEAGVEGWTDSRERGTTDSTNCRALDIKNKKHF